MTRNGAENNARQTTREEDHPHVGVGSVEAGLVWNSNS